MITLILMVGIGLLNTKLLYPNLYATDQFFSQYKYPLLVNLFEACLIAPLIEEVLFRYFPLTLARVLSKRLIIPMIFFSSIIFGLMHYGYASIPLQGVSGLLLCMLYIKNGYSYWSTVTAHALYNLIVILAL